VPIIGEGGFGLNKDFFAVDVFAFVELEFTDLVFEFGDLGEVLLFVVVEEDVNGLLEILLTAVVVICVFILIVGDAFHAIL
jgi:hypothetical protein